jgi:hypothetical protein
MAQGKTEVFIHMGCFDTMISLKSEDALLQSNLAGSKSNSD